METFIVLSLALTALATLQSQWDEFKLLHNKQYNDSLEESRRLLIFRTKLEEIREHNARYQNGQVGHYKGINRFSDWTKEEFLQYVNRGKASGSKPARSSIPWTKRKESRVVVDWRGEATTDVKDQGDCGSCWSFSATGALEGQLALKGRGLISLSEQNLIDCSSNYGNTACDGGWMDNAFEYIHDNGINSEQSYPYKAAQKHCKFRPYGSVTTIRGYHDLPYGNEDALANAVSANGPVAVAIDATAELQSYAGGILDDRSCDSEDLNHGVLVVGYGVEDGREYWILKNSWGLMWGEDGYWRHVKNAGNQCGVATAASYPIL